VNLLKDASGAHNLDEVVSIVPIEGAEGRKLAHLQFSSGGGVTTATDFEQVVAQWAPAAAPVRARS
jgi:hypothetical protein